MPLVCPICGKTDAACGGPTRHLPVQFYREVVTDMGEADIRVDDGHGRLLSFTDADAKAYIANNPGSKIVSPRKVSEAPTPAEEKAEEVAAKKGAGKE